MATNGAGSARALALAGSAIMAAGTFLPVIGVPMLGRLTYVHDGTGDGIYVIALAAVAAGLALLRWTRWVVVPGAMALLVMLWTLVRFDSLRGQMEAELAAALAGGPDAAMAEAALAQTALQWGWAVLLPGALLTIFAGVRAWVRGGTGVEEAGR